MVMLLKSMNTNCKFERMSSFFIAPHLAFYIIYLDVF